MLHDIIDYELETVHNLQCGDFVALLLCMNGMRALSLNASLNNVISMAVLDHLHDIPPKGFHEFGEIFMRNAFDCLLNQTAPVGGRWGNGKVNNMQDHT